MALEGMVFSSRGHPPQMRISTCLAGILAHGHRVSCLPSRVSPVAFLTPLPHTVAGTAPDWPPDGYSALGSLLQPWPLASGIQTFLKNGKVRRVSTPNSGAGTALPTLRRNLALARMAPAVMRRCWRLFAATLLHLTIAMHHHQRIDDKNRHPDG